MSTQKQVGFGRVFMGLSLVVGMAGATGCASSGALSAGNDARNGLGVLGVAEAQAPEGSGVLRGTVRVLDTQVNPLVPVRLTAEGDEVAVRFAHSRRGGAVVHIDGQSLAPIGDEAPVAAERREAPSGRSVRVVFRDGRFIECWKAGDAERGYKVMAQAWTGGGDRIGSPVAISPADSDVLGVPQVVSVDGDHAVATFATVDGDKTQLLAVSLRVL
jgi:hypothetical protein